MSDTRLSRSASIAVAWQGLPHYAARLIRAGIESINGDAIVIGTPAGAPLRGVEEALRREVRWIDPAVSVSWASMGLSVPRVFFQTGWAVPAFNRLGREVKRRGGKVVAFVDNSPRNDVRQAAGALAFRTLMRRRFDAVMVPGRAGRRLAAKFGIPQERVFEGLYGADPTIFSPPAAAATRSTEFLFVGQFIARKGVDLLLRAFRIFRERHPAYRLRLVGAGPLRDGLQGEGIVVEDFLQPSELVSRYREASFFVLPSREDHWGVVVHEAALCGNVLLVSDAVGAAPDLVDPGNGFVFRSEDVGSLVDSMEKAAALDTAIYGRMSAISREKARAFGPGVWAAAFRRILDFLGVQV